MPERDFTSLTFALENAPPTDAGHRDVLTAVLAAIAANDTPSLANYFTEDAELHIHGFAPIAGSWYGRENVVAAADRNFDKLRQQTPHVEAMIEQGEHIALFVRETGLVQETSPPGREDSRDYDVRGVIWWTFRDGKLRRVEEFIHAVKPGESGPV